MSVGKGRSLLETMTAIVAEVESQLPNEHPREPLAVVRSRIASSTSVYREYALVESVLLVSILRHLSDAYFESRVRLASREELANASEGPKLKSMPAPELRGLDIGDHFDYDYVLQEEVFDKKITGFPFVYAK
jgi:hypothetical protein